MIGIILASHGNLALGIQNSTEMIIGKQEKMLTCCLYPQEGPQDFLNKVKKAMSNLSDCNDILFLVDLWGGTPFNQIQSLIEEQKKSIVTGMNLEMVIEACMLRNTVDTSRELIEQLTVTGKESVKSFPEQEENKSKNGNLEKQKITIQKGHMEYVLARIDSRLLHGQVATGWTKFCKPDRIIVVSDKVAHDKLRKKMIIQAAPVGIKAHVIPLYKLVELDQDDRFGNMRVLLLFENVQDALWIVQKGVKFSSLNLGSIAHSDGKVVVNPAISMDQQDILAIEKLVKKGITIDVRKVPGDTPENINELLLKAKASLKEEK